MKFHDTAGIEGRVGIKIFRGELGQESAITKEVNEWLNRRPKYSMLNMTHLVLDKGTIIIIVEYMDRITETELGI